METNLILAVNPGSTSTKLSVFDGLNEVFSETIQHDLERLKRYSTIFEQYDFRYKEVINKLEVNKIHIGELKAVIGRGGLLRPLESGIYEVTDNMIEDLRKAAFEEHASNLGAVIAKEIASSAGVKAYIADPVVVDEMEDIAKITGLPEYPKTSKFHALNHKAMARKAAAQIGKPYNQLNLIVAHIGGGISIGAHRMGRVVEVNEGLYGDGPFSPERAGKLPTGSVIDMCFKEGATVAGVKKRLVGGGGLAALCGTTNAKEIEDKILAGDKTFECVYKAMAYQISKEIGSCAVVLKGKVDGIVITGGVAKSKILTEWIGEWVSFLAPVFVLPGENEMSAMAEAANRVLNGEEKAKVY